MGKDRPCRVSNNFLKYIDNSRARIKKTTGKELSQTDMTEIIAQFNPIIIVQDKKKRQENSIFDGY